MKKIKADFELTMVDGKPSVICYGKENYDKLNEWKKENEKTKR